MEKDTWRNKNVHSGIRSHLDCRKAHVEERFSCYVSGFQCRQVVRYYRRYNDTSTRYTKVTSCFYKLQPWFLLSEKTRTRALDLISQAYSSISMEAFTLMLGSTEELAHKICMQKGWVVEPDTKMVHPVRAEPEPTGHTSSEEQLFKLTDFVSFLEN